VKMEDMIIVILTGIALLSLTTMILIWDYLRIRKELYREFPKFKIR